MILGIHKRNKQQIQRIYSVTLFTFNELNFGFKGQKISNIDELFNQREFYTPEGSY